MQNDPDAVSADPTALPARILGDAEWLLADGAGGYACGTAIDLPRRRYHGLWVARPAGTARRRMVVAALDERIVTKARTIHLLHAHWRDLKTPSAPEASVGFAHRPLPQWTFHGDGAVLRRTVALQRGEPGRPPLLLVRWHNLGTEALHLHVRPLLGWCDADHLPPADETFDGTVHVQGASWGVRPNGLLPTLWLTADGVAAFRGEAVWYRGFQYAEDEARGYDHHGDRWCPGVLELELPIGQTATVAFALEQPCAAPAALFDVLEAAAVRAFQAVRAANEPKLARLQQGADDFLYRADGGRLGVLAGFPWFGEWGRDVFVALPGLTLARGRLDLCAEVLTGALPFLRRGLLPNIYGKDQQDSHYGSCDAALWFALAVQRFADAGGDPELVRQRLRPALVAIADAYEAGTDLGLAVDGEGLLRAGRADLNATWMDARTHRGPVTPRQGLPVEIQALWYALLAFLAEDDAGRWAERSSRCGAAFVRRFWLPTPTNGTARLADRVHDGVADQSVRPNMLVAAALPRAPFTQAQRAAVVATAQAELVTPRGLRTLSLRDPAYRGRYEGGPDARDLAYHQGTVWPWLAGFHVEAALAAAPKKALASERAALRHWLLQLLDELDRAGLDHVSEVFDGDEPQRPGGTFAQAWNTGELLRALALCEPGKAPAKAKAAK
ncbi:MAG: glycogen debranching enzyme family protein [Planctomycetes bacterium]|nr:glycogen debranching enzyme family protein [Planctomycetota bacterium]